MNVLRDAEGRPYCATWAAGEFPGDSKRCHACGASLKGARSRSYCAGGWHDNMPVEGSCVDLWGKHHIWLLASRHAHRLAGGYSLSPVYHRLYPEGECAHAGLHDIVCTMPDGPVQHTREVNHIEPRNGMGYGSGCFNHQSNLEVLCRAHHGRVSGIQARGRTLEHEIRAMERDVAAGRRMF